MLADSVTTTGINWESVLTVIASTATCVIVVVGAFTAWVGRQITHAVNDLSDKLTARLESRDVVQGINLRLTSVEAAISDLKDRTK